MINQKVLAIYNLQKHFFFVQNDSAYLSLAVEVYVQKQPMFT